MFGPAPRPGGEAIRFGSSSWISRLPAITPNLCTTLSARPRSSRIFSTIQNGSPADWSGDSIGIASRSAPYFRTIPQNPRVIAADEPSSPASPNTTSWRPASFACIRCSSEVTSTSW